MSIQDDARGPTLGGLEGLDPGPLSRRGFVMTSLITGLTLATARVEAQGITTDAGGIEAGEVKIPAADGPMPGYRAMPTGAGPFPIVLVVEEIFGVHEYIKDICRRLAKAGYCAVAPELFKREGGVGHIPNVQDILKIVLAVPRKQVLGDVAATVDWAKKRPGARADRVGVTGWCWGGSTVYQVAATNPDIKAAVAWYGPPARPYPDTPNPVTGFDVAKDITMPFLGLYGETDQSIKLEDVKKFEEMVKQVNKNAEFVIYPGAAHGFFADYRPSYNAAAAADAWKRCTGLFDKTLKA